MTQNLQDLLNTIRDNASSMYQERIPEATRTNIEQVQQAMTDPNNAVVVNEFMSTLLNILIKQQLINKFFSDPLKSLKKGTKPLGDTVEEIYNNFIKAEQYNPTGSTLLNRKLPDTKTLFHRMNRQDKYKITVSYEALAKAFSSYEKLGAYIQSIINTLYNSSELDEFVLIKQLIKQAYDNNAIKTVIVADPLASDTNAKAFIKTVKTVSGDMQFPNSNNNAYLEAQSEDTKPIITFSRKDEQILILSNPVDVAINVDVLASVFNMSVAEFNDTRKIVIDAFPDDRIVGALVDEQFFQVWDDLVFFTNFRNPEGLYDNYYLHVWQTLAYSILVNGVVFMTGSDEDEDGTVETFTVGYTLPTGVTSTNTKTSVTEGTKYQTTLKGLDDDDTVTITMGGSDITSRAFNSETNKVVIAKATGNITVVVTRSENPS